MNFLWLAVGLPVAFGLGWFLGRHARETRAKEIDSLELEPRLDEDTFEKKYAGAHAHYKETMAAYDKLIAWGAGGAFVVSITVVDRITSNPAPGTEWILAVGWGLLLLCLVAVIAAPYASTRIGVWDKQYLEFNQLKEDEKETRKAEGMSYKHRSRFYGRVTKWLNEGSFIFLVLGIAMLSLFVFLNIIRR